MTDYDLTDAYHYELPAELVADRPSATRVGARLMTGGAAPRRELSFAELPQLLREGDLLVFNNTRVVPARVLTHKPTGGAVELFITDLLSPDGEERWRSPTQLARFACMTRSSKPVAVGTVLTTDGGTEFTVERAEAGEAMITAHTAGGSAIELLDRVGQTPLPPYILRRRAERGVDLQQPEDVARYQTVYATALGAVAAPTAGLHFDDALLDAVRARGVRTAFLTLDVGPGTFRPVKTERLTDHPMHSETYRIPADVGAAIAATRDAGGRVIAVGTTTVRALEADVRTDSPFDGEPRATDLFIRPGFDFRVVDAMITNFHLPKSTLLALVYAFGGPEEVRAMYEEAIAARYLFYSYGDAMFLTRRA